MTNSTDIDNSDFLRSLMTGNRSECSKIIHAHLNNQLSMQEVYEKVIRKSMYEVGELWELNKISVATEHLSSAIVEAILNELYLTIIKSDKNKKKVVVACVENEFHQIGIKMVSDIFELNGWNSFYLGADTPIKELVSFVEFIKPDLLAISLSIYSHIPILEKMIQKMSDEMPELRILVGGQAFQRGGQDVIAKYPNVLYLPDLHSIDAFIKNDQQNG